MYYVQDKKGLLPSTVSKKTVIIMYCVQDKKGLLPSTVSKITKLS